MFGVVLLFVTLLCAAGLKSYRDLTAARARERQLETRIEDTRGTIDRLRTRIERLRGDPAMLERLAREDLGLVRRQDVVIELPPPQLVAPPPALPSPQAHAPPSSAPPPGP
jgi:cell division protein FtsB